MYMLISKDEDFKTSPVYTASLILKLFQKKKETKLSIFEIYRELKKNDIHHYRQVFFGLAFLYSTGIIQFTEPYIYIVNGDIP